VAADREQVQPWKRPRRPQKVKLTSSLALRHDMQPMKVSSSSSVAQNRGARAIGRYSHSADGLKRLRPIVEYFCRREHMPSNVLATGHQ